MDEGTDLHTGADVKETDSLRSVDLVAAGTHHVDVKIIYVDRHMSVCLNRVGVEQNAMLLRDLANLFDRLDGSDLVICKHHGNENGSRADSLLQLI